MATFDVTIQRVTIEPHPNADRLELAKVRGFQCVVAKDKYETGDIAVYIPEAALVPEWMLGKMGLVGKLAGSDGNRVKTVRLRGEVSTGLLYPVHWDEDRLPYIELKNGRYYIVDRAFDSLERTKSECIDVSVQSVLGIEKYQPPIPTEMAGEVDNVGSSYTINYDIENLHNYPNVLQHGEEVVMTEKLHGTWSQMGYHPRIGHKIITSKGLAKKGLCFKLNDRNETNLYVRAERTYNVIERVQRLIDDRFSDFDYEVFYVLGEVFGKGVQKSLHYGANSGTDEEIGYRVFDVYVGEPGVGRYLNHDELVDFCDETGLDMVPVLYRGPYTKGALMMYTDGMETLTGTEAHIREGVVIKPVRERTDVTLSRGRVILKSVSDDYLTRKGGSERN